MRTAALAGEWLTASHGRKGGRLVSTEPGPCQLDMNGKGGALPRWKSEAPSITAAVCACTMVLPHAPTLHAPPCLPHSLDRSGCFDTMCTCTAAAVCRLSGVQPSGAPFRCKSRVELSLTRAGQQLRFVSRHMLCRGFGLPSNLLRWSMVRPRPVPTGRCVNGCSGRGFRGAPQ